MIDHVFKKKPSVSLNFLEKTDRANFEALACDEVIRKNANLDCWFNGISCESMWRTVEDKIPSQYNYFSVRNETSFIGSASLVEMNSTAEFVEMGFWIGRNFWRLGYGREVVNSLIIKAFEKPITKCIFANCYTENFAVISLLKQFTSIEVDSDLMRISKELNANQSSMISFSIARD